MHLKPYVSLTDQCTCHLLFHIELSDVSVISTTVDGSSRLKIGHML